MRHSRIVGFVLATAVATLLSDGTRPAHAAGTCTVNLIGQLTQKIELGCDPFGCPHGRGGFVSCVRRVLADPAFGGPDNPCAPAIKDAYVKSTYCLRNQNAVPCFQTDAKGVERCRIVQRPEACRTPAGGFSCTSVYSCIMPCF